MKFGFVAFASCCFISVLALADNFRADGPGKVYTDGQGVVVTVVPLKPRKASKALVKVTGTRGQFDDLVLLHDVHEMGQGKTDMTQKWRGKDYTTVVERNAFELHPGGNKTVAIYFDSQKSEALKADQIVNEYYNRRSEPASGPRAEVELRETRAVESKVGEMNQECGSQVKAVVDWKSVPEEALKTWNVGAACGAVADAIGTLCDDEIGKETVKKKIKEIRCGFGKKAELAVSGGKVTWTLVADATDLREKAYGSLMEKL